ncbi:copper homeostasis protein CutC, partial [Streptomyces sp. NPDC004561]
MSKRAVLEVIALDVEDAVAAQAGGADRLELVTEMAAIDAEAAVRTRSIIMFLGPLLHRMDHFKL